MLRVAIDGLMRRPWLALIAAVVMEIVIFVVGQTDFVASDPLWYADIAHNIARDPNSVFGGGDTHPFVMRVGLTLPVALLYHLFGVSTLVTNLYCLLCALGVLVIIYAAAPTPRAKLVGMVLGVFCVPLIRNANILNIDLPTATLMAASVLCLSRRHRPRGTWWIVGGAVALIAAFLVKETALWCGFVWIYALVVDLRASDARSVAHRFAPGIVAGVVLAAIYFAICARIWGSPFARFSGIQNLTFEHEWALHGKPAIEWVHRLTWQTPLMLVTFFQALLVPALASPWLVRGRDRIWPVATLTFILLYWFGSTSLLAYSPLPISPRMILPVLPVLLVTATLAIDAALDRLRESRWRAPLAVALALALVLPAARVIFGYVTRATPETAAFAKLRDEAAALRANSSTLQRLVIVCGEPRCVSVGSFYFGFTLPANVTLTFADDFAAAPLPAGAKVRAVVNLHRALGARHSTPNVDRTGPIEALKLPPIVMHRTVRMYDAGDGTALWQALQPR